MALQSRMWRRFLGALLVLGVAAVVYAVFAQSRPSVFPAPIPEGDGTLVVGVADFATLPEADGPARMMLMSPEPGGTRLFVNDMNGPLYTVRADGSRVTRYLDIGEMRWGIPLQASGGERGFQSFALHPDFNTRGARGYGIFYTYSDTTDTSPPADFAASRTAVSHDTVLLEWTATDPAAEVYDGGAPRELLRWRQPFSNHNAGLIAFNPLAGPGSPDEGLLYVSAADGGSGGDPLNQAQNLQSGFGKILRIDPLGRNSANHAYSIPDSNPFAGAADGRRGEIYAYGLRNPQRFGWDPKSGTLYVADIGQDSVEEISPVTPGANLGWNRWEGSVPYGSPGSRARRSDQAVTYPVAEYAHQNPLLLGSVAITGVIVYRGAAIPRLSNQLLFGDNPSGEVFYVNADAPPAGGQDSIRRVLFRRGGGAPQTLLQLIQARTRASRADLRFGTGHDGRIFLLNKHDGVIRALIP